MPVPIFLPSHLLLGVLALFSVPPLAFVSGLIGVTVWSVKASKHNKVLERKLEEVSFNKDAILEPYSSYNCIIFVEESALDKPFNLDVKIDDVIPQRFNVSLK